MVEGDEKKGFCGFDEGETLDCAQDARLLLSVRSSGRGHNIEKYKKQKFRRYAHSGHGNDHIMLACWLVVVGEEPPANESAALDQATAAEPGPASADQGPPTDQGVAPMDI